MSRDLVAIRGQARLMSANMKQGNTVAAVQALKEVLATLINEPLMRAEKEEFEKLAYDGLSYIMQDKKLSAAIPMKLEYVPGKEKYLFSHMNIIMDACQACIKEEAELRVREQIEKRRSLLEEGIIYCNQYNYEYAERKFKILYKDTHTEANDFAKIGETYLTHKKYEEAVFYLTRAIEMDPNIPPWYNLIAIGLRKILKFEEAEQYYLKASRVLGKDPHLFFNLARLYLDWKRWPNAIKAAQGALKLDPEFVEAQKLINYVQKQQEAENNPDSDSV